MGNKKAILISCTDHYRERVYVFDKVLTECGYDTKYIASDFHHIKKEVFKCNLENAHQIKVRPYKKNLSVDRILSHRDFAKGVYNYLENLPQEPDIIVCEVPPNFLVKYLAKYKQRHSKVKLVFDLFDLWPETFPSNKAKQLLAPAFWVWKSLRNRYVSKADLITAECNLYREVLKKQLNGLNAQTIYLCKPKSAYIERNDPLSDESVELCYLGSINNIIDIVGISNLVKEIADLKKVRVHIIGDGENKDTLVEKLQSSGAEVCFYGKIYDQNEKQQIFDKCHFGINMMKSSVCIGLTMKSIDYFAAGLPILNSIGGDTQGFVNSYGVGFNVTASEYKKAAKAVAECSENDNKKMRRATDELFNECLCESVVFEKIKDEIVKLEELENA